MTPEQAAAHAKVLDAIIDLETAFRGDEETGPPLVVDYVILTATHVGDDEDGEPVTGHGVYTPGHQPAYRTLGLLAQASAKLRHHFTLHGDD